MFDRITINPTIPQGQPTIRGTRLTDRRVIETLAITPKRNRHRPRQPRSAATGRDAKLDKR